MNIRVFKSQNSKIEAPGFLVCGNDSTIYVRMYLDKSEGVWSHLMGEESDGEVLFTELQQMNFQPIFDSPHYQDAAGLYHFLHS